MRVWQDRLHGSPHLLRPRHRAPGPDAAHDVPARRRLRRAHRRRSSPPAPRDHACSSSRRTARRCSSSPPTSSRCAPMGAQEVSPQEAPRAARHDRAPLRPGRPAQAEDRNRRHPMPNAFAHGPLEEGRDRLRDDGHHGAALPGRAGGRHGPRADARRQPRRGDHDAGELLRLARVDDRAVRVLLYAQLIARRVREARVYSEIVPRTMPVAEMLAKQPDGDHPLRRPLLRLRARAPPRSTARSSRPGSRSSASATASS